ncbi:MAG TPA: hypothetical protein VGH38_11275 [Bryobacteraceae bacterium]
MSTPKNIVLSGVLALGLMASDSKPVSLVVRVAPELAVSQEGADSIGIKIRLSELARAQLWIADNCSTPLPDSSTISHSGEYRIPISTLPGSGRMVCLFSNLGAMREAIPLISPVAAIHCSNGTCYTM